MSLKIFLLLLFFQINWVKKSQSRKLLAHSIPLFCSLCPRQLHFTTTGIVLLHTMASPRSPFIVLITWCRLNWSKFSNPSLQPRMAEIRRSSQPRLQLYIFLGLLASVFASLPEELRGAAGGESRMNVLGLSPGQRVLAAVPASGECRR